MVTAELAVATLAALALLVMLGWGILLLYLQMRCVDTAAEVARQSARGDDAGVRRAERDAPGGARVSIDSRHGVTAVEVRLDARPLAPGLPAVPLRARAEVVSEPGRG